MATYKDLSAFTNDELNKMQLTHARLEKMSMAELILLAQHKLDRFIAAPPEHQGPWAKAIPLFRDILVSATASLAVEAIRSVDYRALLTDLIDLLDQIIPH